MSATDPSDEPGVKPPSRQQEPSNSTTFDALSMADEDGVTDAQLGALVRAYRGSIRPGETVVLRPSWWEKAMVIIVILSIGVTLTLWELTNESRKGGRAQIISEVEQTRYIICDMMEQQNLDVPNECPLEATR